jgi:hypothetical protein
MYDRHMVLKEDIQSVVVDGVGTGFTVKTKIPYYRGVALSLIDDVSIRFDGRLFPKEELTFTTRDGTFTFKEMATMTQHRWEYGEKATVFVPLPGGIPLGFHRVETTVSIRVSYLGGAHPFTVVHENVSPMGG